MTIMENNILPFNVKLQGMPKKVKKNPNPLSGKYSREPDSEMRYMFDQTGTFN